MNSLTLYLLIAAILFSFGLVGVMMRRSLIAILVSIELMLNAASLNFMAFNKFLSPDTSIGQIYTLF
ncbi:MAG TPA: NADH-quinone oxidoreductase subunit K, partial [Deltaproteobacteria bacterium]|nr:NADH-quinone oxidoreductase subunit K [Deltaproteobacteria bacterium]